MHRFCCGPFIRKDAAPEGVKKAIGEIEAFARRTDSEEYARATAMRFRIAGVEGSRDEKVDGEPSPTAWDSLALPEGGSRPVWGEHGAGEAFHQATEMRPVMGLEMPALWMRLCVPMVKGEETSPLVTVAAISDSVYSVPFIAKVMTNPRALREQRNISINPDTTLNLHRPLEGEWLCLQGWSHFDESGAGTAFARLSDQRGPIGTASQSILVRGPENRPESWRGYDKLIEDNHKSKSRNQG